jgi:hypothetical protein
MMKSIAVAIAFFFAMLSLPSVAQPRYDCGPGGNPDSRTYPGPPRGTPYWSGYVDAPVGRRSLLPLDYPALLGRAGLAGAPRANLRCRSSLAFQPFFLISSRA